MADVSAERVHHESLAREMLARDAALLTDAVREAGALALSLFRTELIGMGVNGVTGDYSRGASGFWIENGEIAYPVNEITIAGNLKDMLAGIVAVGKDVQVRGSKQTGSILVDRMTVAGE